MRTILTWALWRRPRVEHQTLLAAAQATQTNVDRQKEVALVGQTIADAIWEEGLLKGRSEGRSEGALAEARQLLRQLLADRFGALSTAVLQRIDSAADLNRLRTAVLQVSRLTAVEELQV
jgi:hypothetical protein